MQITRVERVVNGDLRELRKLDPWVHMGYVGSMRELSELRTRRRSRVLAACVAARHSQRMESRETRIRQRFGAEVARLRERLGYAKQPDLAAAASLGKRTITAVENGEKVSVKTLRKVEATLGLEPGVFEAYLAEEIKALPMPTLPSPVQRQPRAWVIAATYLDLGAEADRIQTEEGSAAARLWMDEAVQIRQEHALEQENAASRRDVM
jgi:transcriptional regulator with XRE-family HTH domain